MKWIRSTPLTPSSPRSELGEVEAHREALDRVEQWLGPAVVLRSQLGAMARRIQAHREQRPDQVPNGE